MYAEPDVDDDGAVETMSLKYEFEGIGTLAALACAFRRFADELESREAAGWRLERPVEGGWLDLVAPGW